MARRKTLTLSLPAVRYRSPPPANPKEPINDCKDFVVMSRLTGVECDHNWAPRGCPLGAPTTPAVLVGPRTDGVAKTADGLVILRSVVSAVEGPSE